MEEIKNLIEEVAQFLHQAAGILDKSGVVLSSTDKTLEGEKDDNMPLIRDTDGDDAVEAGGRLYQRLNTAAFDEYTCFIEGTDETSRNYLELICGWLKSALKERNLEAERQAFLKNVLLENELPGDIPLKAREFKILYSARRQAFLVRCEDFEGSRCLELLRNIFPDWGKDYILPMDEGNIVVLLELAEGVDPGESVDEISQRILDTLNAEISASVFIGIGLATETLKDTAKSYREASLALTVGGIFDNESYIMRYDKLGLGRLIYQLPPTLCQMFLSEVFQPGAYEALDTETLLTIQKFFENNLNGSETSRQLFVHRNTLVYRLDKVQKITGLDLRNFDDAVLFKLAAMVRKYLEKQSNGAAGSSLKWWQG